MSAARLRELELSLATVRFTAEDDVVKQRRLAAGMRAMPMLTMQGYTS
jgi:hypothetical protein